MNDVQLISVDDIKELTSISKNVQSDLLEPYIMIAEGYFVDSILGDALVTELKNQITGNSLTSLNQILLLQYVRPVVAWGAWHEYLPFSLVKTVQKGEVLQTSDNSTNPAIDFYSIKRQGLKDKVEFYQTRLQKYLDDNKSSYPLYRSQCKSNNGYGSGIYLGRY